MKVGLLMLGLCFVLGLSTPALACSDSNGKHLAVSNSTIRIQYQFDPSTIQVGEPFSLAFQVCDKQQALNGITLVKFDATMPAHGHGMNYLPQLQALGQSQYRIDDLLLHMPGVWQFSFDVRYGDLAESVFFDYAL